MTDVFGNAFSALQHGVLGYVVPFLFVLTIVVFFHELGHFLVARWAGVKVLTFSLGFGPELVGFNDRHGTRWKISAIPLGGYVKFFGDETEASTPSAALESMSAEEREQSFHRARILDVRQQPKIRLGGGCHDFARRELSERTFDLARHQRGPSARAPMSLRN